MIKYSIEEHSPDISNDESDHNKPHDGLNTSSRRFQSQDHVEKELAKVFCEVLGLKEIAADQNFFEAGVHSLQAVKVLSRIRRTLKKDMSLRVLFEKPTIAQLRQHLESLESEQEEKPRQDAPARIVAASPAQQRLWFLEKWEPNQSVYNIPWAVHLTGPLNVDVLEQSINEIVARHESLRTNFESRDGEAYQVISSTSKAELTVIDLSHKSEELRKATSENLIKEEASRPFNLVEGPLFRNFLIRLHAHEHVLMINFHHIIFDGWSVNLFLKELFAFYACFSGEAPLDLPPLPFQYADAIAQKRKTNREILEEQMTYWRGVLKDAPPLLELPTDYPRPQTQTHKGAIEILRIEHEVVHRLKSIVAKEGCTLYIGLFACLSLLLSRYSQQEDIVIGTPCAGRSTLEEEHLIGFFVNTLALRNRVSPRQTFRQFLATTREVVFGALGHQEISFDLLVEKLNPHRSMSHSPIFQVVFAYQNYPNDELRSKSIQARARPIFNNTSKYDLTLFLNEMQNGDLEAIAEFNTNLFRSDSIQRLLHQFAVLLRAITHDANLPLESHSLLTKTERHSILYEWNATKKDFPQDRCVHEIFEAQAMAHPDAIAVVFKDQTLTYGQLNSRADRLAKRLKQNGVGPDTCVAIHSERCLNTVIGLLAILKAGGAYVPLDSSYPRERLDFMVQDSNASLLLTQSRHTSNWADLGIKTICLDDPDEWVPGIISNTQQTKAAPEDLAYVMYTSGSSGKPKGVAIPHRAILRLLFGVDYAELGPQERFLQLAPISFDASTFEIWGALLHGGTCVLYPDPVPSAHELGQVIRDYRISTMWLTSSLFNTIVDEEPEVLRPLKQLLTGGEALSVPHVRKALELLPDTTLINGYGPTESTTFTCCYKIPKCLEPSTRSISLGRPISNTQVYILDHRLQPVPIGLPGELCIGGDGLALGYLNRPELNHEKFIPNPFMEGNQRLYRSGDKARFLPDGRIEYLGRIDKQIKIRGFRIEPGEIEATMLQHPLIQECIVVLNEEIPNNKRLVAYYVPSDPSDAPTSVNIRSFLAGRLPDYMIPAAYIKLKAIPLTPNGKADPALLPSPDSASIHESTTSDFPGSPSAEEKFLQGIWTDILTLERIGLDDNFFQLGGNSLMAMRIVSRVQKLIRVELPIQSLFEAPTISLLAQKIRESRGSTGPLLIHESDDGTMSFAQQRLWFLNQWDRGNPVYNILSTFRIKGPLDHKAFEQSLNLIGKRHECLRSTFKNAEPGPRQELRPAETFAFNKLDLQNHDTLHQQRLTVEVCLAEANWRFDLEKGPLCRFHLLCLSPEHHLFLINIHHIIFDGWSVSIFLGELTKSYELLSKGKLPDATPLEIQYSDFARWQQKWLTEELLQRELQYWKMQLSGLNPCVEFPTTRPRPPVQTFRGASEDLMLSSELFKKVRNLAHTEGITMFMVLLTVFKTLIHRYTGLDDIVVGSPVANRYPQETERLLGLFVNTLALRTTISSDDSFKTLLAKVQATTMGAYAHQNIPFEKLVGQLQQERDLSRNPLFQIAFSYENFVSDKVECCGLSIEHEEVPSVTSKFDLTLFASEKSGSLKLVVEYNTDLFDRANIRRILDHFHNLLNGIVDSPDASIATLPMLSDSELHELLVEWNQTTSNFPREFCVQELFETQAIQTPDAIALVSGNETLTYLELNRRANKVANYLRKIGLKRGMLVGVYLERSSELIVILLGILKAGGAYVPLDQSCPIDRISLMLKDSGASFLITHSTFLEKLSLKDIRILAINSHSKELDQESEESPQINATSDDLIYVIYTSGSTGKPKGVAVPHHAVNRLVSNANYMNITARDVVAQASNSSFDAATFEIWGALINGARMIIIPTETLLSPGKFASEIERHGISVLFLTTALFNQLAGIIPNKLARVRNVLFGGERVDPRPVKALLRHGGPERLLHVYGPTETTTFATWHHVTEVEDELHTIPIGRPISNTEAYILDKSLSPVPIGVPGDLYIGGSGVAKGYIHDEALTRSKFIPNPFKKLSNEKIYQTGDRARFLENGSIEFLGRVDNQIKLRGFRIELGEIEGALRQCPDIKDAVVIIREEPHNDKKLIAYFVPKTSPGPDPNEIRSQLARKLPEYMLPAALISLPELPLNANGKVNRFALPLPQNQCFGNGPHLDSRTPLEFQLKKLWQKFLGTSDFGVRQNFFDLGGHSLLAVQLLASIEKRFGKQIPLVSFFQNATIEKLAGLIEHDEKIISPPSVIGLQLSGCKSPFFCVPGGGDNVITFRHLAKQFGRQNPFFGLQPSGLDREILPFRSIPELANHFISEMRTIQPEGPYYLGGHCFGSMVAFEMAKQLHQEQEKIGFVALIDPPWMFFPENALFSFKDRLRYHYLKWISLDARSKAAYVSERLKSAASRVRDQVRSLYHLPTKYTYRNVIHLCEDYELQQIPVKLLLFLAQDLYLTLRPNNDPRLLWRQYSSEASRIYRIPGGHNSIFENPNASILAEYLTTEINESTEESKNHRINDHVTPISRHFPGHHLPTLSP